MTPEEIVIIGIGLPYRESSKFKQSGRVAITAGSNKAPSLRCTIHSRQNEDATLRLYDDTLYLVSGVGDQIFKRRKQHFT